MQLIQDGAALAPGWTEALFHELLDQEASPASGAALHHAADIMSLYDTAKTRHCMAGMQQSISGKQVPLYTCIIDGQAAAYHGQCFLSDIPQMPSLNAAVGVQISIIPCARMD